jgi:general secretion pathway protein M
VSRTLLSLSRHASLAALAYAGVLLCVFGWIILMAFGNNGLQTEFAAKADMLDTIKRRGIPDLAQGDRLQKNQFATISAATETIAASTLQTYVLGELEKAGGTVQSIQAESSRGGGIGGGGGGGGGGAAGTPPTTGGLHRLSAQLSFESGNSQLQQLLFELETGTPFVFVDTLSVQPSNNVEGGRVGDRLRVNLVVSSYWQDQPAAGTAP